jgi:hypothetical protein
MRSWTCTCRPSAKSDAMATTSEVRAALRKQMCAPEWAMFHEVSNGTGARGGAAYADVVAMSLYPSRGLELHGMEIKVSRGDWQRERAKPNKAEIIAAYCDRWWLVTGPNVVHDIGEIPMGWGWKLYDGSKLLTKQQPTKLTPRPMDRVFLAALLRRASEAGDKLINEVIKQRTEVEREANERRVAEAVRYSTESHERLKKSVAEFEEASGISLAGWSDKKRLGRLAMAIDKSGVSSAYYGLDDLASRLVKMGETLKSHLADCGLDEVLKDAS